METNILMESGTNELEVLEFIVGGNHYGINVAKIKEIVPYSKVTPVPNSHPCVEGVFMPRDLMITIVDLAKVIKCAPSKDITKDMFIITNFNKLNVAFHVASVVGIHRVSWTDIIKPDSTISSADSGIATGVVKINGQLIIILDFERIVSDISPETGLKVSDIEKLEGRTKNEAHIVIAEDSPLLMKLISDSLIKSGYDNLTLCANGQEAWENLVALKDSEDAQMDVACVITDLEMPLMDGHRLTKLIKTDDKLKNIPVVIFSSLINDENITTGIFFNLSSVLISFVNLCPSINGISKSVITQATSICASSESFRATRFSQASCPLAHNVRLSYPDLISESEISFISNGESSAITICASFLVLPSSFSISDTFNPVSGLISDTILSKSRMIINCPLILTTPVAIPLSALLIVLSGLIISVQDTLCIPTTDAT